MSNIAITVPFGALVIGFNSQLVGEHQPFTNTITVSRQVEIRRRLVRTNTGVISHQYQCSQVSIIN